MKNKVSQIEQAHLDFPPSCPCCGEVMFPQIDLKLKRTSGFVWRCNCMPSNMVLMLA